jgi:NADP-dependent 3-hydroxy acid dehydrogenase YdfG
MLDRAGQAVLAALPEQEVNMADDRQLREFTCDPKFRKVLITDGKTALGQSLVQAFAKAQADLIWVGHSEPWKVFPGFEKLKTIPGVTLLPLDLTDSKNVREVAAEIGVKVDIVVNNAEHHRAFGIANRAGVETARAEMDVNYFGLLRLAQELGPVMRARGADGQSSAVAWVNLLSIYALANFPPHGTFSASKAAAHSLAQCLRASCRRRRSPPLRWRAPSSRRCRTGLRTSIPATWRRNGLPAGATIPRRWNGNCPHERSHQETRFGEDSGR